MCPVFYLVCIFTIMLLALQVSSTLVITLIPAAVERIREGEQRGVLFQVSDMNMNSTTNICVEAESAREGIAKIYGTRSCFNTSCESSCNGTFTVEGVFLGYTEIRLKAEKIVLDNQEITEATLDVSVVRKDSALSQVFVYSVAVLVSLNYINMGCALDLSVVKSVLVKPVAPAIGFFSQFAVMPLVAFGVGKLLFEDTVLQLGLFTFGCSPGGGASNMWTVLLGGNLNLSITLTFISTTCALFMMPFWLFTLGRSLFHGSISSLPYTNIFTALIAMVIPLGVGLAMQRYLPKTANFCRRIIVPASIIMIIYIVVFGTYSNLYMFKVMSWQVILSAAMNVWVGFAAGFILAKTFKISFEDTIAIAIETGVQNTGIAIVLLGTSLLQPSGDLASVIPVAASIMTPIPLVLAYAFKKMYYCRQNGWSKKSGYEKIESKVDPNVP